jgi:hypothetical protein
MTISGVRQSVCAVTIQTPEIRPVSTAIAQVDVARLAGEVAFASLLKLRQRCGGRNTVLLHGAAARWI